MKIKDRTVDIKLVLNGIEVEPKLLNHIMLNLDDYIKHEAKEICSSKLDKITEKYHDKYMFLCDNIDAITNVLTDEFDSEIRDCIKEVTFDNLIKHIGGVGDDNEIIDLIKKYNIDYTSDINDLTDIVAINKYYRAFNMPECNQTFILYSDKDINLIFDIEYDFGYFGGV